MFASSSNSTSDAVSAIAVAEVAEGGEAAEAKAAAEAVVVQWKQLQQQRHGVLLPLLLIVEKTDYFKSATNASVRKGFLVLQFGVRFEQGPKVFVICRSSFHELASLYLSDMFQHTVVSGAQC